MNDNGVALFHPVRIFFLSRALSEERKKFRPFLKGFKKGQKVIEFR
jgi:hypothetical protein